MYITANYWTQIVKAFKEGPEHGTLCIAKTEKGIYRFSVGKKQSDMDAKLFGELIGNNRLNRIYRQVNINSNSPLSLTKENVHKIFIGMMDIQKKDITGTVEENYKQLMLFDNYTEFENAFMLGSPNIEALKIDRAASSGKGFKGLTERILIQAHHYFSTMTEKNEEAKIYRDSEFLASRIIDREIPKGTVLRLSDGYFYVDEVFSGGGAYVAIFRDINHKKPSKIVCRGTAIRRSATSAWQSGVNDLLLEIGSMGVKSIWPELSKYLINNRIGKVEILGKSLGGAHAQELAVLIEGLLKIKVEKLTTYCSVGVGQKINNIFKNEVLSKRKTSFNIQVIRNGGTGSNQDVDYVPAVGGEHLGTDCGSKCNIEMTYISTDQKTEVCNLNSNFWTRINLFVKSFRSPHQRQTTLQKFHWTKIENNKDLQKHLKVGKQLETIRQIFAWIIHLMTFFLLNGRSFQSYYLSKVREANPSLISTQVVSGRATH